MRNAARNHILAGHGVRNVDVHACPFDPPLSSLGDNYGTGDRRLVRRFDHDHESRWLSPWARRDSATKDRNQDDVSSIGTGREGM